MASRRLLNDDDDVDADDDGSRRLERGRTKERGESNWYDRRLGRVRRARVVRKGCDPKLASACVQIARGSDFNLDRLRDPRDLISFNNLPSHSIS